MPYQWRTKGPLGFGPNFGWAPPNVAHAPRSEPRVRDAHGASQVRGLPFCRPANYPVSSSSNRCQIHSDPPSSGSFPSYNTPRRPTSPPEQTPSRHVGWPRFGRSPTSFPRHRSNVGGHRPKTSPDVRPNLVMVSIGRTPSKIPRNRVKFGPSREPNSAEPKPHQLCLG